MSSVNNASILKQIGTLLIGLNEKRWATVGSVLSTDCTYNGKRIGDVVSLEKRIMAQSDGLMLNVERTVFDIEERTVVIHISDNGMPTGGSSIPADMPFFKFNSADEIMAIDTLAERIAPVTRLPSELTEPSMSWSAGKDEVTQISTQTRNQLEATYRGYIDSINAGTIAQTLPSYCHSTPYYNDRTLSRAAYQANIDAAFEHMPDARFEIEQLAIDAREQQIAARLAISGKLIKPFLGLEAVPAAGGAGYAQVTIREHVLYKLREGKIDRVWSLLKPGELAVFAP